MCAYFWQVADAAEHREDALDHLSAAQLQVMHAQDHMPDLTGYLNFEVHAQ